MCGVVFIEVCRVLEGFSGNFLGLDGGARWYVGS